MDSNSSSMSWKRPRILCSTRLASSTLQRAIKGHIQSLIGLSLSAGARWQQHRRPPARPPSPDSNRNVPALADQPARTFGHEEETDALDDGRDGRNSQHVPSRRKVSLRLKRGTKLCDRFPHPTATTITTTREATATTACDK